MDVLSFETEVRQLIGLQQEGEYWDFKKEWHQNKADLLHDIICMANNLSNQDGLIIIGVDEENDYKVTGNGCPRGAIYGKKECTHPTRVVTSTVKIVGAEIERLSVKTNGDIPKEKIFDVMKELNRVVVKAPVHREDVIVHDICGTGVDLVATKDL